MGEGRGSEHFKGIRPVRALAILGLVTAQCSTQVRSTMTPEVISTQPGTAETFSPPRPTETYTPEFRPYETLPVTLQDGYSVAREGQFSVITYEKRPILGVAEGGLELRTLANNRQIFTGLEPVDESHLSEQLPQGSELVLDSEGYPKVLRDERIAGVFFQGELLIMPGMERWGADEIQVVIKDGIPRVTSLMGTELYRFESGEWKSVISPDEETEFLWRGRPATTGYFQAGPWVYPRRPRWNQGELGRVTELIARIDNPIPYQVSDPVFEGLVVEGVISSPVGEPTLIKIPIYEDSGNPGFVRIADWTNLSWQTPKVLGDGRPITTDEYIEYLRGENYIYLRVYYQLVESLIPAQYKDHPLFERYREIEASHVLDFMYYPTSAEWPYSAPILVVGGPFFAVNQE